MVRIFKKSMPKITALLIAVMMILSLLPLSGLVSASTETYPESVTITAKDVDGAVSGATVSYTIHSDSTDGDIVAGSDKDISSGEIELISKEVVLAHFTEHPGDTLKLNATIEANGHEDYEIKDAPISVGDENFDATLLKVINATDVIALPATSLTYNGSDQTLMTINAVKDDKVTYEVDGSKTEKTVTEESEAIQITGKTAKDYEIKVSIQRDGYADFVYPVPDLTDPEKPVTTVTVTINKADAPTFSFNMSETCTFNYVNNTFVCDCTDETYTDGKTEFSFEILDCTKISDLPIATIENGIVTYNNVGFVTIKATASRGDNYKQDTSEHTFTVNIVHAADFNAEIDVVAANTDKDYESDGILYANGEGVIISAEGWQIMDSKSDPLTGTWSDSLPITDEGDYANLQVRFKKNNGDITDLQTVTKHFVIDETAPTLQATNKDENKYGVEFTIENDDAISQVLNFLSFGIFFNKKVKVTINAEDSASNIAGYKIKLYSGTTTYYESSEYLTGNEFVLDDENIIENFKGNLKVSIIDNVGNEAEFAVDTGNSNLGITPFMIENDAPVIEVIPDENNNTGIYNNGFSVDFKVSDIKDGKEYSGVNYAEVKVLLVKDKTYSSVFSKEYYSLNAKTEETETLSVPLDFDFDSRKVNINNNEKNISDVFDEEGKITFVISAVDNAGNVAESKTVTTKLDHTSPTISYSIGGKTTAEEPSLSITDYGYYFNQPVDVIITATDPKGENETVSSVNTIKVCAIDNVGNLYTIKQNTEDNKYYLIGVDSIDDIFEYTVEDDNHTVKQNGDICSSLTFGINTDFKGQLFTFATDKVGNDPTNSSFSDENAVNGIVTVNEKNYDLDGYTRPNGSILETPEHHDQEKDHVVISLPENTYYQNDGTTPLFAEDIDIVISVKDEFAGIRKVELEVKSSEDETNNYYVKLDINNQGVFDYDPGNKAEENDWAMPEGTQKDSNLIPELTNTIKVSNNSNDIKVTVTMTDRAGNTSTESVTFGIDKTIPDISVSYYNNSADSEKFFKKLNPNDKATRTATISIAERNFDPEKVVFYITKNAKAVTYADLKWTDKVNPDNNYEPIHETTVDFIDDGDYTFNVECTDLADNKNHGNVGEYKEIDFGDSVAPQDFVVDNTLPIIDITYDNNSAQNGNYYKAERTATIKITEHNFDDKRFELTIKSASETTFPDPVGWTHSGDNHYATIAFTADSLYKFDVEFMDKAGNKIKDYPTQEFTVDKTNPTLTISGIVDESANADSGNIGFVMTAIDTNLDAFTPVITAIRYSDGKFETITINPGVTSDVAKGRQYSVANIDTDGIYMIRCTVTDKAGNAFTEVILDDPTGKKVVKQRSGNDVLLTFSVNRNGSVFYVDGYTEKTINKYYVQGVTESIRIYEINPDEIVKDAITINGKTIKRGTDYSVSLDKGEGSWYKYTYSINKSVFNNEGEYNIVVSSTDKAENQAYSDVKKLAVKFVVDKTAPVVTVAGIKTDGRYRTDKQIVKVLPSDDGGLLKKLIIRTVDEDGKVIKELINLEGDALLEAVEKGEISFELGEGLYQNVQIICEDAAGNITGENAKGEIYENVSISTNAFLIFWANKVARYLAISGVCVVLAGAAAFVFFKKRKA